MLENLLDGIKGQVASALVEKTGLDLGQAEQAVPAAGDSIKEGLMGAISGGNITDIMSMFSGDDMQGSSIFQTIAGLFTSKLGALGIGGGSAVSALALPMILNKIKGAASGESGQLDASGLMSVLGGGDAGGLLGGLAGAMGGGGDLLNGLKDKAMDAAGDGGGLLGNAMDALTGGASEAGDATGDIADKAADLLKDKLGGFFGK